MTEPARDSLILQREEQEKRQMALFSDGITEAQYEELEREGQFTGERLFNRKPEIYRAIVSGLANGMGIRQMSRAFRVHPATIRAVRQREGSTIDTEKKEVVSNLSEFVRLGSERMLDELPNMDADKLPVNVAIVIDKLQLLNGQATSRVEHVKQPGIEDFNRIIEVLPSEASAIGSCDGNVFQKAVYLVPTLPNEPVATESQAVVLVSNEPKQTGSDTALDTKPEALPPSQPAINAVSKPKKRGGGGRKKQRGGQKSDRSKSVKNFTQEADLSGGQANNPKPKSS